ncbi:hypothetical protein BKK52_00735 [Rodentibacter trehalosifermentans]|uniref:DUF551 domain-containing protein n=1 Tax=Rodentibacter trehalosifermentans TaxID=1908263 RepID=A0A1V3J6L9_9PAST|nr:DUF551 domain-containing protein [Rodentibacter trehalosifermentans]OOF50706.1 hypothetical protein BKK52_00735 [Rodentibacter trehalosifermentans]
MTKENNGWISVIDRLPEEGVDVIVYSDYAKAVFVAWLSCEDNTCFTDENGDYGLIDEITHWQPLPEPPKED